MARAPALLAVAIGVAACGPTKDGVAVAPLRPGPALIRYEQTRGSVTIRVVAPESREKKVEKALEAAFAEFAISSGDSTGVDAAAERLLEAGLEDFVVQQDGGAFFAGDAGGEAWRFDVVDPRGERRLASIAIRDQGVGSSDGDSLLVTVLARDARAAASAARELHSVHPERGPQGRVEGRENGSAELAALQKKKLEAVLVSAPQDGPYVMTVTQGLKGRIEIEKDFAGEVRWQPEAEGRGEGK